MVWAEISASICKIRVWRTEPSRLSLMMQHTHQDQHQTTRWSKQKHTCRFEGWLARFERCSKPVHCWSLVGGKGENIGTSCRWSSHRRLWRRFVAFGVSTGRGGTFGREVCRSDATPRNRGIQEDQKFQLIGHFRKAETAARETAIQTWPAPSKASGRNLSRPRASVEDQVGDLNGKLLVPSYTVDGDSRQFEWQHQISWDITYILGKSSEAVYDLKKVRPLGIQVHHALSLSEVLKSSAQAHDAAKGTSDQARKFWEKAVKRASISHFGTNVSSFCATKVSTEYELPLSYILISSATVQVAESMITAVLSRLRHQLSTQTARSCSMMAIFLSN